MPILNPSTIRLSTTSACRARRATSRVASWTAATHSRRLATRISAAAAGGGPDPLDGRDLTHSTPRQRLHAGVAYVPEDRQEDGLVGAFSVADNMVLDSYDRPPFASGINLHLDAIASNAAERVEEFDVRTQSAETPVGTLPPNRQVSVGTYLRA